MSPWRPATSASDQARRPTRRGDEGIRVTLRRHTGRSIPRRVAGALVASIVVLALGSSVGASPALAATDYLRESVVTTYRVDGAKGAIHVTLDIKATNTKPSTATTYFYFNSLSFGIQPEAR